MYTLIIVDYNGIQNTIDYIRHCKQQLGQSGAGHVVIVENGDRNDTVELLQAQYGKAESRKIGGKDVLFFRDEWQQICYVQASGNLGYARGNNLGVRIAEQFWNDPFYIISNNDLILKDRMDLTVADRLFAIHPEIGVIGPNITTPTGVKQSPRVWQSAFRRLFVNVWVGACGAFLSEKTYRKLSDKYCNDTDANAATGVCAWVSGCFMLVRADFFRKAGMFDENTFLYAEEMILSRRMARVGSAVWFCQELEVVHNHAQTTKKALSVLKMREIDYRANRYYFKEYERTCPLFLLLADGSFALYKLIFYLWQRIKSLFKKNEENGKC